MKSEKGVTLISVIIYVIVMLIVVSVITILTSFFYNNVDTSSENQNLNEQYTKFNSYFVEEVNKKGNEVLEIGETDINDENNSQKYIVFSSGNQYTYIPQNQSIYVNQIKIASNITDCIFETNIDNGKTKIIVTIKGNNFERTTTYTLVN